VRDHSGKRKLLPRLVGAEPPSCIVVRLKDRCADPRENRSPRLDETNGTAPSGQNKAATLPQSDGIFCLRPQPTDTDIFPCSEDRSDERKLLPSLVSAEPPFVRWRPAERQVSRPPEKQVSPLRWSEGQGVGRIDIKIRNFLVQMGRIQASGWQRASSRRSPSLLTMRRSAPSNSTRRHNSSQGRLLRCLLRMPSV
jgi:hypothetical protein